MTNARLVANAFLALGTGWLVFAVPNQSAQAQAIFCPGSIPSQAGIALSAGTCTNGTTGAFSNAALASQALSDLSQSTTQQASATVENTLGVRRQVEQERCPDGFERVNGVCQRIASAEPPLAATTCRAAACRAGARPGRAPSRLRVPSLPRRGALRRPRGSRLARLRSSRRRRHHRLRPSPPG